MSDIIRKLAGLTPRPAEFAAHTTKTLARLCHEAEDTGNDLLLIDVQAEIEAREQRLPGTTNLFMEWYWILWDERKKPTRKEGK